MGKRAEKPTKEQAMLIAKNGLHPREWLVFWESERKMCLISRVDGTRREIDK